MNKEDNTIHVLLADDDEDDAMIFSEALEQLEKVTFKHVENGSKLLLFLENEGLPDLLFLDIIMPYKTGIECLSLIRAMEKCKELPILMYSTTTCPSNIDTCFEGGANLYIIKPNTFEGIVNVVKSVCNNNWLLNVSIPTRDKFLLNAS